MLLLLKFLIKIDVQQSDHSLNHFVSRTRTTPSSIANVLNFESYPITEKFNTVTKRYHWTHLSAKSYRRLCHSRHGREIHKWKTSADGHLRVHFVVLCLLVREGFSFARRTKERRRHCRYVFDRNEIFCHCPVIRLPRQGFPADPNLHPTGTAAAASFVVAPSSL